MQEQIINKTSTTYCTRRKFLINTIMGLGTITLGSFTVSFISGCSDNGPTGPAINNDIQDVSITVDISLSENQSLAHVGGTLALGSNALDIVGILLYRSSETSVLAYSRRCTHNGCTIGAFQSGTSTCPCHGSKFDTSGSVVNGPAATALKQYHATLQGTIITITP